MIVRESISFERGKDPKDSIGIGDIFQRQRESIKNAMQSLVDEFGGSSRVYKTPSGIKGLWKPGPERFSWEGNRRFYNYSIEAFVADDGKLYFSPELSKSGTNEFLNSFGARPTVESAKEKLKDEFLKRDSRRKTIFKESVSFERGSNPMDQMGIGLNAQFQDAIEKLLKTDSEHMFVINSIAFPKWSDTIDFVCDDWSEEDPIEDTKEYITDMAAQNESFDIFDFIDSGKWAGGGYKNGVYKFTAPIDKRVVKGLREKCC